MLSLDPQIEPQVIEEGGKITIWHPVEIVFKIYSNKKKKRKQNKLP